MLTVSTIPVPYVAPEERVSVTRLGNGLFNARVQCHGSWKTRTFQMLLMYVRDAGVPIDPDDVTFFLGARKYCCTTRSSGDGEVARASLCADGA